MNYLNKKCIHLTALTVILFGSCTYHHEEEDIDPVIPDNPVGVTETIKYGLERQAVLDHFGNVLKNQADAFTAESTLAPTEVADARDYVWDLWCTAVKRGSSERLPQLSSHYKLSSWGDISTPDAIWTVPEGKMSIFYGSKGECPADGYPLFLFLHGSGADVNGEWTTCLDWAQVFQDGPSAYFLPKSPQGGTGTRWFQPSKQEKWEQMLRQAMTQTKINPRKIYFMGISEGAYGSQRLASFYPDYLAGAGPIAGGEFLYNCPPENLSGVAFTLQTGANDKSYARNLLTERVGSILNELETAHPGYYTHKVELQAGMGHSCDYTKTTPWLVNYERNATPKYFHYENFGLGGINGEPYGYRDAFYNLRILEKSDDRSNEMARTVYEMNIIGNTVNLTVSNVTLTTTDPVSPSTGTVNIGVEKTYTPATSGRVRVYLSNELVDLTQPVTINVNGNAKFTGNVSMTGAALVESCALFYDPLRLFTAYVDVDIN